MQNQTLIVRICRKPSNPFQVKLTWKSKKAYPFGGKYDLLSALWGQSTTKGPKRRKLALISSERKNRQFVSITRVRFSFFFSVLSIGSTFIDVGWQASDENLAWIALARFTGSCWTVGNGTPRGDTRWWRGQAVMMGWRMLWVDRKRGQIASAASAARVHAETI